MEEFLTVCPRNCYSTCSFRVQIENNRIKRILPYEGNLATPEGPCIKGLSYIERAVSPKRIRYPLLRKSDGSFFQITMNEALDRIAENLNRLKQKYGPMSVLWYRGSGNSGLVNEIGSVFWKYFGGATTTYGNLCWPAGLEAVKATLGSVKHNVPWDLENAGTIVIWGKNPAETNIQEMAFIVRARQKGARVIVIDPRRTPTADKADLLYCPLPGTDAALALAIASVLIKKELINREFISKNVVGFEKFIENSLISPDNAGNICGISSGEIENLAELIGNGDPVTFLPGYGLQRYTNGGQTIRSILSLAIITGNIGRPGAGFNFANLQSYIYDDPKEPDSYYPDNERDKPFRRSVSMARLGRDILNADNPEIKAIWVERGNPLLQSPDIGTVAKAFSKSDFTVVVEQFMTDTALKADIVLPAKDIFEQSDIIGSYWSPYVQFKPGILRAEGEIMPESEIYYYLAKKMELDISTDLLPEPGNTNIEKWLERRISGNPLLTLSELRKGPLLAPGLQQIAYEDMKFETPSGKIELFSSELAGKWNTSPFPVYIPLDEKPDEEFPLFFMSPNTSSRIHSQFGNLDVIRENSDFQAAGISESDALERGLSTGDRIEIFNRQGMIETLVRIDGRLSSGLIILYNGIWIEEGGGGNNLTKPEETDMGHGAAFHGIMVQVRKIGHS
jgi:anaerobic selenocysteine-containing dehydrogenase